MLWQERNMPQLMNSTNKQQPQGQPVMGNPLELFNMLAGAQGNLPEQKAAKADLAKQEQTQQVRSAYDAGKASNPNTSGTMLLKDILDKYKAMQGIEAIAQGVPYNQVLEQSLNEELKFNDYQTKIVQSLQGGQAPQPVQELRPIVVNGQRQPQQAMAAGQPQQPVAGGQFGQEATNLMQEPRGILQGILQGFAQGTGYTGGRLDNLQKAQKLAGQEPIQAGELEKQQMVDASNQVVSMIKARQDLSKEQQKRVADQMTKIIVKPALSGEASTKVLLANQGLEGATGILDGMNKFGNDYIKTLATPNSYEGQKLATFASMIKEANARLPGGASLSKNELEFAEKISTPAGVKAAFTNTKYAKQLTESLVRKYQKLIDDIDPNAGLRDKYRKAKDLGWSDEEITDFFIKKGDVYGG